VQTEGITIRAQISCLVNPTITKHRRMIGEIAVSLIVFLVYQRTVVQGSVRMGIKAAGLRSVVSNQNIHQHES